MGMLHLVRGHPCACDIHGEVFCCAVSMVLTGNAPFTFATLDCVERGTDGTQVAGGLQQMLTLSTLVFASLGPYSVLLLTDCGHTSIFFICQMGLIG